eukprot:TRINITY_DN11329_c0_g1_i2.p1 TRINITY_DN11329_c0_g1~~TRINITY_DN11329_c0_g1_i2.p1  ORF type:complete len:394 (-),score=52.48 TRINITY_DN11329_c0_g1_i2:8-1189(-)
MIAIWVITFLQNIKLIDRSNINQYKKNIKNYSLIEFGPGRGTLICDILRVFSQFKMVGGFEINLIEFSPFMSNMQQKVLVETLQKQKIFMKYEKKLVSSRDFQYECLESDNKELYLKINWFKSSEQLLTYKYGFNFLTTDVSKKQDILKNMDLTPNVFLAHEFFDSLPTNIFVYQKGVGWCEKLVNVNHNNQIYKNFEFILSNGENENVKKFLNPKKTFTPEDQAKLQNGDTYEIQPRSQIIANQISELIALTNGGALIIDYGEDFGFSDSVRAIKNHKFIKQEDILEYPGEVDLSAYVSFNHLRQSCEKIPQIKVFGPIPQGLFLESMGINTRIEMLTKSAFKSQIEKLKSQYERLVSADQMGSIYKFIYVGRESNGQIYHFITQTNENVYG